MKSGNAVIPIDGRIPTDSNAVPLVLDHCPEKETNP